MMKSRVDTPDHRHLKKRRRCSPRASKSSEEEESSPVVDKKNEEEEEADSSSGSDTDTDINLGEHPDFPTGRQIIYRTGRVGINSGTITGIRGSRIGVRSEGGGCVVEIEPSRIVEPADLRDNPALLETTVNKLLPPHLTEEAKPFLCPPSFVPVHFADLVGVEKLVALLSCHVVAPLLQPKRYRGAARAPRGVLFHGPPGSGKTSMARAIATETRGRCHFLSTQASSLVDAYYGVSEKRISALFQVASLLAPTIVFIDEAETLVNRDSPMGASIASALKTELDGFSYDPNRPVTIVLSTNFPELLEPAILSRLPLKIPFAPLSHQHLCELMQRRVAAAAADAGLIYEGNDSEEMVAAIEAVAVAACDDARMIEELAGAAARIALFEGSVGIGASQIQVAIAQRNLAREDEMHYV